MPAAPNSSAEPCLLAIDWGTSRFRAYLVTAEGLILDEVASEEGMAAVTGGNFAQVLRLRCGAWLNEHPQLSVLMAGMVGSRNGWREVPYVTCPAAAAEIAKGVQQVEIAQGRTGGIVPGLLYRETEGIDVMRGEETLILGTGIENGSAVMPGTHSKWASIEGGRISRFKTFMTGEFYALLREHSVLRLLAADAEDHSGFERGLAAAKRQGGILHQAFAARTAVLDARMTPNEVGPFLSGLLIAHEIDGAIGSARISSGITLIAEGELGGYYQEALAGAGARLDVLSPRDCFVKGMLRLHSELPS